MLEQVRTRGVAGFVVQMTLFSVTASVVLVAAMMLVLYGPDDPTFWPGMLMALVVPALVAPPVLVFSVRLAAALDRASHLLWQAANTDPLTEVANRRAFFDAMEHRSGLADRPLDIAIVDLDAFKSINDRHGHSGGDLALVQVARWLVELCGPEGLVARMGGDEFAVARPVDTAGERPASARFDHDGMRYSVTVGWARLDGERTLDEVLRLADAELYAHKPTAVGAGHG